MVGNMGIYSNPQIGGVLRIAFYGLFLLLSLAAAYYFNEDMNKAKWQADAWMNPVVTQEEEKSMEWVRLNTAERETFVTDIFGGEHMMGESLREGTEGGDWAIIPNVVTRMSDVNEFFKTDDSQKAYDIAKRYGANYVMIPNRQIFAGFEWMWPERTKLQNTQYFELAYKDGEFEYYRVK
ncbi:MAG: hypothetical protein ABH863_02525 [Candidatus Micrarchaeota archaeon]